MRSRVVNVWFRPYVCVYAKKRLQFCILQGINVSMQQGLSTACFSYRFICRKRCRRCLVCRVDRALFVCHSINSPPPSIRGRSHQIITACTHVALRCAWYMCMFMKRNRKWRNKKWEIFKLFIRTRVLTIAQVLRGNAR